MDDELTGDGMLILDGENIATVYYWLTVVPEPGAVIAEGSITGSEDLMRRVKKSDRCETRACRWSNRNPEMLRGPRWRAMGEGLTSVTRAELMPVHDAVVAQSRSQ
jgi:hypothetical protein